MRYSISTWKAHRWIASAHGLENLPRVSEAFETGRLGVDKVVELTRFATPSDEAGLVRWATTVSGARIRRKAELATRDPISEVRDAHASRSLSMWFYDEHRRFHLDAELSAADGAVIAKAIRRQAEQVPHDPDAQSPGDSRLADGLVRVCSGAIARDPDPDRATVLVHLQARALTQGPTGTANGHDPKETAPATVPTTVPTTVPGVIQAEITSAEIASGPVIHPVTAARLACEARIQVVVEDLRGEAIAMGRTSREPSAALMRQLRYRDRECTFPGCGATRFLVAHHLVFWSRGGKTNLEDLASDCTFHHWLVHEGGWSQRRDPDGTIRWFRPDGTLYVPGPAPPPAPVPEPLEIAYGQPETEPETQTETETEPEPQTTLGIPRLPPRLGRGP
jgi:uncharacterized protein DUF222